MTGTMTLLSSMLSPQQIEASVHLFRRTSPNHGRNGRRICANTQFYTVCCLYWWRAVYVHCPFAHTTPESDNTNGAVNQGAMGGTGGASVASGGGEPRGSGGPSGLRQGTLLVGQQGGTANAGALVLRPRSSALFLAAVRRQQVLLPGRGASVEGTQVSAEPVRGPVETGEGSAEPTPDHIVTRGT